MKQIIFYFIFFLFSILIGSCSLKRDNPLDVNNPINVNCFSATIGVLCKNGGTCAGGKCNCPAGYSGIYCETPAPTSILYHNNTLTPVFITVNGITSTIPVDSSITYHGVYGSYLNGSAYTNGTKTNGAQIGTRITWNLNDTFPTSGTKTDSLNVDSTYFFLEVKNQNPNYNIDSIYVNYGSTMQTIDSFLVPNNNLVYKMGYYHYRDSTWNGIRNDFTDLYLLSPGGVVYWQSTIDIYPHTNNQIYIFSTE